MTDFVITTPASPTEDIQITLGDFWPTIGLTKLRNEQGIDASVSDVRLQAATSEAMATIDDSLAAFRDRALAAGITALENYPGAKINQIKVPVLRYFWAVGCLTKATLLERYRSYDTTGAGDKRATAMESPIDDLRRDAFWALADLQGKPRTVVELI